MMATALSSVGWPVMTMTGTSRSIWRMRRRNSVPEMPGMLRSVTMTWKARPFPRSASASIAFGTVSTLQPLRVRARTARARTSGSSSTTRTSKTCSDPCGDSATRLAVPEILCFSPLRHARDSSSPVRPGQVGTLFRPGLNVRLRAGHRSVRVRAKRLTAATRAPRLESKHRIPIRPLAHADSTPPHPQSLRSCTERSRCDQTRDQSRCLEFSFLD